MKILITGAAGFIGSHLYQHYKTRGEEVIGIDNFYHPSKHPIIKEVQFKDVRDNLDDMVEWSDVVFHLAAQIHVDRSIVEPKETIDINVNGTLNVLEACKKYNKKLVFASTSEIYGTSQTLAMDENHPLDAQSPYGASKVAGDRLCHAYRKTYGMDIATLRNFNTFGTFQNDGGAGSNYGSVIGIFTRQAIEGRPITIFGDGRQERDYMYISDAISAYDIARGYDGIINAGTGETVTINQLAIWIKDITQSDSEIVHVDARPGEVMRLCANIKKIKELGFVPKTRLYYNLKEYVEWYKDMASK